MAALHHAETTLWQATTAANQSVSERIALVHYDTPKVTVAACSNHQAGRRSACEAGGSLTSASSWKTATSPVTNSQPS